MRKLSSQGTLVQVVPGLVFVPEAMDPLTEIARQIAAVEEGIRAGAFRDRTGLGRERSIQILESFNRVGFTRRVLDSERSFDRAQDPSVASALDRNRLRWGGQSSNPVGASDAPGWVRLSLLSAIFLTGSARLFPETDGNLLSVWCCGAHLPPARSAAIEVDLPDVELADDLRTSDPVKLRL